jgi:hypothetical protein
MASFKFKWFFPMLFFQGYLTLSQLLFFYGPWDWNVSNPLRLLAYLSASQVFILLGYCLGWGAVKSCKEHQVDLNNGLKYFDKCLLISVLLIIPTSLSRTGSLVPDVFAGLSNGGQAYNENYARLASGNPFVIVEYLRMFFSVFLVSVYPLMVVYWTKLNGRRKLLSICVVILMLSTYIATGTNKGLADFVISIPLLVLLAIWSGNLQLKISKKVTFIIFSLLMCSFLAFFGNGQKQREGGVGERGVFNTGSYLIEAKKNDYVSNLLGADYVIIYESLTRYLGQGYKALSMSFNIETESTFGFGNSMFFSRNGNAVFNTNFFTEQSIPGVLEKESGWGMMELWHSIYPWLASDFGFIGTLVVMLVFSFILSLSWGYSLKNKDPLWVVMFYLMMILFFYIPGNNQIFQAAETSVAFVFLCVQLFVFAGRRVRI